MDNIMHRLKGGVKGDALLAKPPLHPAEAARCA